MKKKESKEIAEEITDKLREVLGLFILVEPDIPINEILINVPIEKISHEDQ